jgi:4-amino-4-deoxy-L-arabinose transferase-like glycosyltransferase
MMKARPPAPLAVALLLQLAIVALIWMPRFRVASYDAFFESAQRNTAFVTLYEAAGHRQDAYKLSDNHYTPTAVLVQSVFTLFPERVAAWIIASFSLTAVLVALVLMARMLFRQDDDVDRVSQTPQNWFTPLLFMLPLVALSAPLAKTLFVGASDAFPMFLIAASMFLATAPLIENGAPKRGLDLFAGIALAIGVALNPYYILALTPFIVLRRGKVLLGFLLGAAFLFFISYRMWFQFFQQETASAEVLFRPYNNSSLSGMVFLIRKALLIPKDFPAASFMNACTIASLLLFTHLLLDWKTGLPRKRGHQAKFIASYAPFALALPLSLEPRFMLVALLALPLIALLWTQSTHWVERAGILTAAAGWALTQAYAPSLNFVNDSAAPYAVGAFGTVVLLGGLALYKLGAFTVRFRAQSTALLEGLSALPRPSLAHRLVYPAVDERWVNYAIAGLLAVFTCGGYWWRGFSYTLLATWALSMAFLYAGLAPTKDDWLRIARKDGWICAVIVLLFAGPYLLFLHDYPVQVNTDELIFIEVTRRIISDTHDWFGLDAVYYYFPNGSFLLIGWLSQFLGGVTLENARLINAIFGLGCIAAGYAFFRQLFNRRMAAAATLMLGASHALLGLSRMSIRDNLPLLVELLAMTCFLSAWRKRNAAVMFLGGVAAGLGAYNYFSARIVLIVWIAILGLNLLRSWSAQMFKRTFNAALLSVLGFVVCTAPMFIASYKTPKNAFDYPKTQTVFYPEGRRFLRHLENTTDTRVALARNISRGLMMFNNNSYDKGYIYINPGWGFVDPLTGILLWAGVFAVLSRRRKSLRDIAIAGGLFASWLPLTFLLVKNPGYSRYLLVMPFVIALALTGARISIWKLTHATVALPTRRLRVGLLAATLFVVFGLNAWAYADCLHLGVEKGDVPGNTVRYAEQRRNIPNYAFYTVMDKQYPYFHFGTWAWEVWIKCFAGPNQKVELVESGLFLDETRPLSYLKQPCTVFMRRDLWQKVEARVSSEFKITVRDIVPSGEQVAVEIDTKL